MLKIFKNLSKFFYEKEVYFSPKNGKIVLKKFLGTLELFSNGFLQSGPYVTNLWRKVFKKISKNFQPKIVLWLGLGGGGGVKESLKFFKKAKVIAIDYDPVMIDIAQKFFLKKVSLDRCQILLADAFEFVQFFQKPVDLILVDLFLGTKPSPILKSEVFLENLKRLLKKEGYLVVNFFRHQKEFSKYFEKYFGLLQNISFWFNKISIYKTFLEQFLNPEQSLIFLRSKIKNAKKEKIVGKEIFGLQKDFGFFRLEKYVSVKEPEISSFGKPKIVIWQRIGNLKPQSGWFKIPFKFLTKKIGVVPLKENYFQNWSLHHQHHLKRWLKKKDFDIVRTSLEKFLFFYDKSKHVDFIFRWGIKNVLRFHYQAHPENLNFFLVLKKPENKVVGGLAVLDYPDISQSFYLISFLSEEGKKNSVGVGLFDFWHKISLAKNLKFLNFGILWKEGDPKSWQGFSNFKKKFGVYEIFYTDICFKILI